MLRAWPAKVAERGARKRKFARRCEMAEVSLLCGRGPVLLKLAIGCCPSWAAGSGMVGPPFLEPVGSGRRHGKNSWKFQRQDAASRRRCERTRAPWLDGRRHASDARLGNVDRRAAPLDVRMAGCRVLERCARRDCSSIPGRGAICRRNRRRPARDAGTFHTLRGWPLHSGCACLVLGAISTSVIASITTVHRVAALVSTPPMQHHPFGMSAHRSSSLLPPRSGALNALRTCLRIRPIAPLEMSIKIAPWFCAWASANAFSVSTVSTPRGSYR
jgi:hypothetical protein